MFVPVILSGGAGTRLWPVSREAHPKPFLRLADGNSLLQKAFLRASRLPGAAEVLTVTNRDYFFQTRDEYIAVNAANLPCAFLLEPCGRNTAPAVIAAALVARERHGKDALMLVMPSDHLIGNEAAFADAVAHACALAGEDRLVTFGIRPDRPETGYGYIEVGPVLKTSPRHAVARFVEKPDLDRAKTFLAAGTYLWNSGMFCFKAQALLDEAVRHAPALLNALTDCVPPPAARVGAAMVELDPQRFATVDNISLDYALMEKSDHVAVVACEIGWSDIGAWDAIGELTAPDARGNRVEGDAFLHDVADCYFRSDQRVIGAVGVRDLFVVDTPDALLVAARDRLQDVKHLVQRMRDTGHEAYRVHRTVHRPWGTYTVLEEADRYKIKRIVVKPGAALSLQLHHHRSEHWIVVSGMARVTHEAKQYFVRENESTFIPAGHRHRLENPGMVELVMIEVQSGGYVGEDDIVRFEDNYGRSS